MILIPSQSSRIAMPSPILPYGALAYPNVVGRYRVGITDPPWAYASRCTWSDTRFGGGVHSHYPTLPPDVIARLCYGWLPMRDLFAPDAALFMWTTGPHLEDCFQVFHGWGFRYTTIAFTWIKTYPDLPRAQKDRQQLAARLRGRAYLRDPRAFFGAGYYTASNAEICLLGVRGRMQPVNNDVPQVILAPHPRDEVTGKIIHSRKPSHAHHRAVRMFGDLPRIEIFARTTAPGWDVLGNQIDTDPVQFQDGNDLGILF